MGYQILFNHHFFPWDKTSICWLAIVDNIEFPPRLVHNPNELLSHFLKPWQKYLAASHHIIYIYIYIIFPLRKPCSPNIYHPIFCQISNHKTYFTVGCRKFNLYSLNGPWSTPTTVGHGSFYCISANPLGYVQFIYLYPINIAFWYV